VSRFAYPITRFINEYRLSFFVYLGVAAISAVTEWSTFYLSLNYLNWIVSALIGFLCGSLVNFLLSRSIAFRSVRPLATDLALLTVASGAALVVNFATYATLYVAGLNVYLSKMVGTVCGFGINYVARQFWIFSRRPRLGPTKAEGMK